MFSNSPSSSKGGGGGKGERREAVAHLCPSISGISASEDRVSALYSPLRPRESNPEAYDLKLKFWSKALEEFVHFGGALSFTLKEAQKGLMVWNKTPGCLPDVLEHLRKDNTILSEKEYQDHLSASVSWVSWGQVNAKKLITKVVPLPPNPLTYFTRGTPPEERYVHVAYLKSVVNSLSKASSIKNSLMSLSSFKEKISQETGIKGERDISLLLHYLATTRLIALDKVGHEDVVFYSDTVSKTLLISDADKGKYDVQRTKELHEERLEEIYSSIDQAKDRAKEALKRGRRPAAKLELKKKKLLEQRAEQLTNVVDSLTVISMKIDQAESDANILQAYKSGKQALSDVLKKNNLTADNVTEAMLDVQDILEEQGEIAAAISQPMEGQDDDLAELDAELESMLKEDEEKEAKRQQAIRDREEEDALMRLERLKVRDDLPEFDPSPSPRNISKGSMDDVIDSPGP